MSYDTQNMNDPLSFVRSLWSGMGVSMPGMVAPTFDVDELDKRIKDMKAVEGWLRMNLSMLQMTIQGLEMQRTTVGAVKAMGQMASDAAKTMSAKPEAEPAPAPNFFQSAIHPENSAISDAAMWPWQMMQQMREQMQQSVEAAQAAVGPAEDSVRRRRRVEGRERHDAAELRARAAGRHRRAPILPDAPAHNGCAASAPAPTARARS